MARTIRHRLITRHEMIGRALIYLQARGVMRYRCEDMGYAVAFTWKERTA